MAIDSEPTCELVSNFGLCFVSFTEGVEQMGEDEKRDVLALAEREEADELLYADFDPLAFKWDAPLSS
jgi:hypothetical protein